MEQEKDTVTDTNTAIEETPTMEINGEKSASESEENSAMEVVEPETVASSEENGETTDKDEIPDEGNNLSITKESETEMEVPEAEKEEPKNEQEKTEDSQAKKTPEASSETEVTEKAPERKTRKRKASDMSKDTNSMSAESKEIIESESSEDKREGTSDLDLPPVEGLGKGKRARIPNKRYSDIAISPAKIPKVAGLENGEKEKEKPAPALPIERIDSESSGVSSPTPKRMKAVDLSNPNYLKPFKLGWKRELVWRSTGDMLGKRNGDIYYYNPEGKKLRSMREVAEVVDNKTLFIENFTFFKEPLGLNDPEKEIIRDAKVKGAGTVSTPLKKSHLGKPKKLLSPKIMSPKIQSPKIQSPKIQSPKLPVPKEEPPASTSTVLKPGTPRVNITRMDNVEEPKPVKTTRGSVARSNNTTAEVPEPKTPKSSSLKVKVAAKPKSERKATPAVNKSAATTSEDEAPMAGKKGPQRRAAKSASNADIDTEETSDKPCEPCSIRCPGVQGFVPTLQCRVCLCLYHNECVGMMPNINVPNYICKNCQLEQGGQNMPAGIAPPPLTPITALQSVTAQSTALPKLQRIPKSPEAETADFPASPPIENADAVRPVSENTSILGHVTSWLPQNSRIQVDNQQRSVAEASEPARPQYVEFLGGRKFLIIPKYNVVSVSPTVTAARSVEPSQMQENLDFIPAQNADVPTTVKTEPISPSKPENSQTSESSQPNVETMDVDLDEIKTDVPGTDLSGDTVPVTNEAPQKVLTPRKKTLKINNVTSQSHDKSNESIFMENYLQNLSYGYNTLLYVFQYLKVQDLLRAGCVCTMWKDIASHPLLWRTVRMKNSQVHSFEGLANTLQKHGTVQLDLRKMLLTNCDEIWPEFSSNIGKVETLRKIELCRCPASVVEKLMETNPKLEVVNAVTIRCEKMNLDGLTNWTNLRELRLKSTTGLTLQSDIDSLRSLVNLKSLSLTSIRDLNSMKLDVIAELNNLESLDLGECTDFPENFGKDILSKLTKLEKLRLEKGQGNCHTFEMLDAVKGMEHLEQLELVNFDIKAGFDKSLGSCKNIRKLLIIPTYISQSATTNHMVLGGVLRLQKSLSHFVWGVTLELLRVTELFVDQCEEPEKKEKKDKKVVGNGDSIPVLKPVPLITDEKSEIPPALDPPQVEILALPGLQKLLLQSLPTTRVKILKIPFHATWRQSITDAVN